MEHQHMISFLLHFANAITFNNNAVHYIFIKLSSDLKCIESMKMQKTRALKRVI